MVTGQLIPPSLGEILDRSQADTETSPMLLSSAYLPMDYWCHAINPLDHQDEMNRLSLAVPQSVVSTNGSIQ